MRRWKSYVSLTALILTPACGDSVGETTGGGGQGGGGEGGEPAGGSDPIGLVIPSEIDLKTGGCGDTTSETVSIENPTDSQLSFSVESSNAAFTIEPSEGSVGAGESVEVTLSAEVPSGSTPGEAISGKLTITTAPSGAKTTVDVSIVPSGAHLVVSPATLGIGDVALNATGTGTVTISNDGDQPVTLTLGSFDDAQFSADTLADVEIPAGDELEIDVSFTPEEIGQSSTSADVTVEGSVCGTPLTSIAATGNGTSAGGGLMVMGVPVDFGAVTCGASSDTHTITLRNEDSGDMTWSAALLTDVEGDDEYYSISPESGTLAPDEEVTLTLTRLAVPLPTEPRDYNAVLRIHSEGSVAADRDIDIEQTLTGPVLSVDIEDFDFGFAPGEVELTKSFVITNSGTLAAFTNFTITGDAAFSNTTPASIAPGADGTFDITYASVGEGVASGTVEVGAAAACNTVTIQLDAGVGPWAEIENGNVVFGTCNGGAGESGSLSVVNLGNEALVLSNCVETSATDVAPSIEGTTNLEPSESGSIGYGWDMPNPLESGDTDATIQCDTNEKFNTQREFTITRTVNGVDLELTPLNGPFTFSCTTTPFGAQKFVRITNNGNEGFYVTPNMSLPPPLFGLGSEGVFLDPGAETSVVGTFMGSSTCFPGNGSISVFMSSANICSITPPIPVTMNP